MILKRINVMTSHIMPTYGRSTVCFSHGQGVWLWDDNENCYLDALAGIAVCNLGHAHPAVHQAISHQSQKLLHTSNLYSISNQNLLADRLCALSGMDNVFFSNSGAEANEAAIKIARLYGHNRGIDNPAIMVMENSFHGRTLATLSATGNPKVKLGFSPLVEGFIRVPFNDIETILKTIKQQNNIVAILVEPVQGEAGIRIPATNYLNELRGLCDEYELLLMLDEIQTGVGRTGKFLAYQHNNIIPDVCTLAKALGNGFPIGACMAKGVAAKTLTAGTHGSTFGGNPLACSAALAVLNTLEAEQIIDRVATKGQYFHDQLSKHLQDNLHVLEIRQYGLMIGIELDSPCGSLVASALENNLLINVTAETTIRLLPPLVINEQQMDTVIGTLTSLINQFTQQK
jgi:acetylornithine aminotransferase